MHSPASATIKEARVMREKTAVNEAKPKSKGYGFVTFAVHEDALDALRKVNNNPHIFTALRRPVVEFSVENKAALEAKEKRAVRSREKNPTFIAKHKINTVREAPPVKQNSKKRSRNALDEEDQTEEPQTKRAFMGLAAEQGNKKVPAHLNPKIRHRNMRDQKAVVALQKGKKISRNMLKRQKKAKNKETSLARRSRASKRVFNATGEAQKTAYESESSGRIEKQRKKAGPGKKKISARDKAFDGLVAKYKAQFKGIAEDRVQKRKWFSVS
ncbi:unnamed protein product [Cyprideis torosa]|uniref:RRM domain-containing protein n=1 Tax=Cyprideis torosa TaxID=163714 RepID=A0A7R8WT26_9CRUS|nr:unnamed protein product [Cyprideis torosa]CAG0909403.1 unnamed protein product [Cyprideis torosa]